MSMTSITERVQKELAKLNQDKLIQATKVHDEEVAKARKLTEETQKSQDLIQRSQAIPILHELNDKFLKGKGEVIVNTGSHYYFPMHSDKPFTATVAELRWKKDDNTDNVLQVGADSEKVVINYRTRQGNLRTTILGEDHPFSDHSGRHLGGSYFTDNEVHVGKSGIYVGKNGIEDEEEFTNDVAAKIAKYFAKLVSSQ